MSLSQAERNAAANLLPGLLEHENELQFTRFTNEDAFTLGLTLKNLASAKTPFKGITILITRNGQTLFQHAMDGKPLHCCSAKTLVACADEIVQR